MEGSSAPRVAVLGVGLIGGSIGLAARERLRPGGGGFHPALGARCAAALAAAGEDAVVTDVGSTKRGIVAAVGDDRRFVGGHPLAGAETAGVANARADLFDGARWYLTPTEQAERVLLDRLQRGMSCLCV